ncbi:MAG TPA: phenylalanine--tRNA ligase subunit beta [Thermoanaerobaculia bacterium]|jgi:phenylalanyl-tRNA synthetase beta chain|nr:phenylalanine--tRNA ligase subunit beta [Thermoanaerobaculia bacterium]
MKFSRQWLNDYVDLSDLSDDELGTRLTEIGHAIEAVEKHGDDTVFDLEITTNRVDAMSHLGMARELAAAIGREANVGRTNVGRTNVGRTLQSDSERDSRTGESDLRQTSAVTIRIDAPDMCARYTAKVIRNITVRPSSPEIQRRLEEVGLRPINNIVDATNYVMVALGHPLHAFDLDRLSGNTIIVCRGKAGETMKSLDGEMRKIDPDTVVIADAQRAVGLGGIIGGFESEITQSTKNVLLECAWFEPSAIRRTARRLGLKTDASYRFERRVDPNDTLAVIEEAARLIVENGGGIAEAAIDKVAREVQPKTIRLRTERLHEASANSIGAGYALDLFRRLGFSAEQAHDGLLVTVPTYRGDIFEEADLIEEVLRFFGLNNVPASLPRVTTGDVRREATDVVEDAIRDVLVGCGLSEAMNYSFIRPEWNALMTDETPIAITNALSENIEAMRLSLIPGLLETVVFNRSYGTRDGALFEVGRTYHRGGVAGRESGVGAETSDSDTRLPKHDARVKEQHRVAVVMYGSIGTFWGDAKRAVDFFDIKGIVEQIAKTLHVDVTFAASDQPWLRGGKRAIAWHGDRQIASLGFLSAELLQKFGIKGDVAAAEIDVEALIASSNTEWKMAPVARFPGVPMILALTHGRDLEYQRIIDTINSFNVPHLHEVGLRDRFVPEGDDVIKTTLGMWYQAFDRSLTQEEIASAQQQLATRLASTLPVKLL